MPGMSSHCITMPRSVSPNRTHTIVNQGHSIDRLSKRIDQRSSDDEYLFTLGQNNATTKTPTVSVHVNDIEIEVIVDTGVSTDILDETTFAKVNHLRNIELQTPTKHRFAYGSDSQLEVLG